MKRSQGVALGLVALVFLGIAGIALGREEVRRAETNGITPDEFIVDLRPGQEACLARIVVPGDAAGVRLFVGTFRQPGPRLAVLIRNGAGAVVRRGTLGSGYDDARWQLVRFEPVDAVRRDYALCVQANKRVALAGNVDPNLDPFSELRVDGVPRGGEIAYEFVRAERETLLELVPTIFDRASLFRPGWIGPWTYYLAALVLFVAGGVAVYAPLAASSRRVTARSQVIVVAAVALANVFVWSIVMPAFQPPDEAAHYAYTASLVDHERRPFTDPAKGGGSYSAEENLAIAYVAVGIVQDPDRRPPWTEYEEAEWRAQDETIEERQPDLVGGGWTTTAGYSPLYYGLTTPLYAVAADSTVFTRLWLMRLLSVLMAAATAVLALLAVREVLPWVPYAPLVAGLTAAFQPMLSQIGGAVNNDNLLILLASLELYLLMRLLRRGLTPLPALAAGAVLGLGILAKPTMYAFVPVAILAFAWLVVRERRQPSTLALSVGLAVGATALITAASYALFGQGELVAGAGSTPTSSGGGGIRTMLSYLWQWYLPALPFMRDFWPAAGEISLPAWDIYFRGFWASFGHLDTNFPNWVYTVIGLVSTGALVAAVVGIARERGRGAVFLAQLIVLGSALVATALLVTYRSYLALVQSGVQPFAQGRYLLQAVVVVCVVAALAARGLGDRWGPTAGSAIVMSVFALNMFSLGLVLVRFYT